MLNFKQKKINFVKAGGVAFQVHRQSEIIKADFVSDTFVTRKNLPSSMQYVISSVEAINYCGGEDAWPWEPGPPRGGHISSMLFRNFTPGINICMDSWTRTLRINLSLLRSTYALCLLSQSRGFSNKRQFLSQFTGATTMTRESRW